MSNLTGTVWECCLPEVPLLGRYRVVKASEPMQMETHEGMYELLFLDAGRKELLSGGKSYVLSGGDAMLIPPGEPHGKIDFVQNRSTLYFVLFDDPGTREGFLGLNEEERREFARMLSALSGTLLRAPGQMKKGFEGLFACAQEDTPLSRARMRSLLTLILLELGSSPSAQEAEMPADILSCVEYIRANMDQMPSVRELADRVYLSEPRFKQKFKRFTGVPPAEFLMREKVARAKALLSRGDESISVIAARMGFTSSQHFTVMFKRYLGVTPSQYRKTMK